MINVGDKYIIELETVYEGADITSVPDTLWRVKGFRSLVFDEEGLKKLVPLDQMRPSWWDEAYKKGLDEAWELARRLIRSTSPNDLMDMGFFDHIVQHLEISQVLLLPYSEALAKLRDYEARKKAEDEAATFKREILFRGKRIDTGEWVFGSLCNRSVRHPYIEAFEWEDENHPVPVAYDVEPESVGQFTGLEDANGTRIFEGDMFDDYNVVTFCNGGFCVNGDSDISLWLKQTVKGNEYDKKHGPF